MEPGWTNLAAMQVGRVNGAHGVFFAYRADTGDAKAMAIDTTTYTFTPLKSYTGPTALQTGWTLLTSVP
jgi:hypothetical protein